MGVKMHGGNDSGAPAGAANGKAPLKPSKAPLCLAMIVAILRVTLLIRDAQSIKDKRSVINSLKARLHREHQVSVAEVGLQDRMDAAEIGIALASDDAAYANSVLDRIEAKINQITDAEPRHFARTIISPDQGPDVDLADDGTPIWTEAERRELP